MTMTVGKVLTYTLMLLLAYGAGVAFVFLLVVDPGLIEIVAACKIVSLFVLIYANREIPHTIDIETQTDLLHINKFIIVLCTVIAIMLIIKTVVQDYSLLTLPPHGAMLLGFFNENSYWLSTLPIFLYCLMDIYIAFVRRSAENERRVAMEFILFRDLVCAVPLALVLILTEAFLLVRPDAVDRVSVEMFFSGAIAVIQLSSAISSRALDVLQTVHRGPVLLTRELAA